MKLTKQFHFEAAHSLPQMKRGHKCRRPHGHSYVFEITAEGTVCPRTGFTAGIDYADLSRHAKRLVIARLDHTNINKQIKPFSTAEHLARWIWRKLKPVIPQLCEVAVQETRSTWVRYNGPEKEPK